MKRIKLTLLGILMFQLLLATESYHLVETLQSKRDKIEYKDLCFYSFCLGDSVQKIKSTFAIQTIDTLVDETSEGSITKYVFNNTIFEEIPSRIGRINSFSSSDTIFGLKLYNLKVGATVDKMFLQSKFPLSYNNMVEKTTFVNGNSILQISIINNPFNMHQMLSIYFKDMQITGIAIITYE
jgi:hypothetical protein